MRVKIAAFVLFILQHSLIFRRYYCKSKRNKVANFPELVALRHSKDIFDFEYLAKPLPYYPIFYIVDCNYYGIMQQLYSYMDKEIHLNDLALHDIYIEHGITFGSYVNIDGVNNAKNRFTYSEYRNEYICKKTGKNLNLIGPYIHYVEPLLDEAKFNLYKKQYGRILMVFPSHSIGSVDIKYDQQAFCNEINRIKSNFDTVIVCMFWRDIETKSHQIYIDNGFKIATAGHINDPYFLRRLRSLIELSDMMISNNIGTHVGYGIYLNKPNYIFRQEVAAIAVDKSAKNQIYFSKDTDVKESSKSEIDRIANFFTSYSEIISKEQYDIVSEIWGIGNIKTKEELIKLFK